MNMVTCNLCNRSEDVCNQNFHTLHIHCSAEIPRGLLCYQIINYTSKVTHKTIISVSSEIPPPVMCKAKASQVRILPRLQGLTSISSKFSCDHFNVAIAQPNRITGGELTLLWWEHECHPDWIPEDQNQEQTVRHNHFTNAGPLIPRQSVSPKNRRGGSSISCHEWAPPLWQAAA